MFSSISIYAQEIEHPDLKQNDTIVNLPFLSPEFPGGPHEMARFIQENFLFTTCNIGNQVVGTIWINFIVEVDGSLTHVKLMRHVSENLNKEAIRVVSLMPKWTPGEDKNGKLVRTGYTVPIRINLR